MFETWLGNEPPTTEQVAAEGLNPEWGFDEVAELITNKYPHAFFSVTRPCRLTKYRGKGGKKVVPRYEAFICTDDNIGMSTHFFVMTNGWTGAQALFIAFVELQAKVQK